MARLLCLLCIRGTCLLRCVDAATGCRNRLAAASGGRRVWPRDSGQSAIARGQCSILKKQSPLVMRRRTRSFWLSWLLGLQVAVSGRGPAERFAKSRRVPTFNGSSLSLKLLIGFKPERLVCVTYAPCFSPEFAPLRRILVLTSNYDSLALHKYS